MAKLKRLGHENAVFPAGRGKGRGLGCVLGEGLFAEHGFDSPRIADPNPGLRVKGPPSADNGNVQLGLAEHGVEVGVARCNAELLAVAHQLRCGHVADGHEFGRGDLLAGPAVSASDAARSHEADAIGHGYTCGLRSLGSKSRGRK